MKVIVIGTGADCDMKIDDNNVSKYHVQLVIHEKKNYSLVDLNSKTGTFVNGKKINSEYNLVKNDIVKIGNTIIPWEDYILDYFSNSTNESITSNHLSNQKLFVKQGEVTKKTAVLYYKNISAEKLSQIIYDILSQEKYKKKKGTVVMATYEKGNRVLRLLFGAFVKYYKFRVVLTEKENGLTKLSIRSISSGWSGGLIGISQVKKEFVFLLNLFKNI